MSKLKIDLHPIYNKGDEIDELVRSSIRECHENKIKMLEVVHGKGSGALKKRVLRILQDPELRHIYHRVDKDSKNHGRLFIRFKH